MSSDYDLIIIGGGAIGLASAYQFKKRIPNSSILILEQFYLGNQLSSSSGDTRQFRLQYSEDYMTKLSIESQIYWDELNSKSQTKLISNSGSLWFGKNIKSSEGQIRPAIDHMKTFKINFKELNKSEIEKNYGFKNLDNDIFGFFQENGGTIDVVETLKCLKNLCKSNKVEFLEYTNVINLEDGHVHVDEKRYSAQKILITCGPYSNKFLNDKINVEIWNMASMYFLLKDESRDLPSWFYFGEKHDKNENLFYGFEKVNKFDKTYMRICPASSSIKSSNVDDDNNLPSLDDIKFTEEWVKKHLPFLHPKAEFISIGKVAIPKSESKKLYIDFIDNKKNILHCSSGWAFKFVPLLGKICSELLLDQKSVYDIQMFKHDNENTISELTQKSRRLPF